MPAGKRPFSSLIPSGFLDDAAVGLRANLRAAHSMLLSCYLSADPCLAIFSCMLALTESGVKLPITPEASVLSDSEILPARRS